jgi:hypothetical protein
MVDFKLQAGSNTAPPFQKRFLLAKLDSEDRFSALAVFFASTVFLPVTA